MSDFDKEAEREKLEEKYGDEAAEREATQQMSELLLQGATMTNAHCDDHGDPIFRYDGEEFCPTCRAQGEGTVGGEGDGDEAAETAEDGDPDRRTTGEGPEAGSEAGREGRPPRGDAASRGDRGADPGPVEDPSGPADAGSARTGVRSDPTGARSGPTDVPSDPAGHRGRGTAPGDPGGSGRDAGRSRPDPEGSGRDAGRSGAARGRRGSADDDLAAAEASLRRTLVRFARRAEDTDDPRRAREDLRVAREAAETLSALNE